MGRPGLVRRRIAARLLLASCTLALGVGLGMAVAVVGVLRVKSVSLTAYLAAIARGLLPAIVLTILAVLIGGKALVAARRFRE